MKFFSTVFAVVATAATALAQMSIDTPAAIVQCQPVALNWRGGTPPYFLSIIPGGQVSAAALIDFGSFETTSYTWTANITAGTSITLKLTDGTGNTVYSSPITIQSSSNSACIGCGHAAGVSHTGDFPVLLPEQSRPIGVGVASLELLCGIKQSALEVSELFDYAFHLKTSHALGFSHTSSASNDYFSVRSAPQFCPGSTMTSAAPATTSTAVKARGKRAVFSESSTTIPPSTTTGTEAASTPVASLQMSRRASLRGPPPSLLCPQGYMACLQTRGSRARWECASESALTSCGGCPTSSEAEDCTEIVGAESVQCVSKKCQISTCEPGYTLTNNSCQRTANDSSPARRRIPRRRVIPDVEREV